MNSKLKEEIKKLSIPERILLVEDIWDSIARDNESFELSQSQRDEIDKRSHFFDENPSQGRTWDEIKAEFLKSK
ncbi:MAG: addiction module protein [Ignavibacteria bacterium]|nr:addiction module protein [Ignavibacteria bacterium]